ncbi:MAG: phosphopentomutase/phosphoglucosamine mutase [Chloroflexi bacterium]|nr:phosphopentomutase/phosphoglucosamine mutase [Chloroflexota bacterium]
MELFGSSGYRAIVDRRFMDTAFKFGFAMGDMVNSMLIGRDTRTSSDAVKHCIVSGILARGCKAFDAGVIPTPTLAYCARDFDAAVMITASHNPPQYNGLKPWNPDGSAFDASQLRRLEETISGESLSPARWENIQALRAYDGAAEKHLERTLKDFPGTYPISVVVDCGGGAGSVITPELLRRMGCKVTAIHSEPTGFFPREIEPTEENLSDLSRAVVDSGAGLGLAHDADADRLVAVDEKGKVVPGDKLMALLAQDMQVKGLVTTVDASMAMEDLGFALTRTRVGDAYVSEQLRKGGEFGGEPCGAWVFPRVSFCPDGVYAAAMAVKLAVSGKLSEQAGRIPSYPIRRGSIDGEKSLMHGLQDALLELSPISVSTVDGVRLAFEDAWLLARASGTEPKVRITVEGRTRGRVDSLYESALAIVRDISRNSGR